MMQHDILIQAGFTEEGIQELCRKKLVELKNSDYVIVDGPTLIRVIQVCLQKQVDPTGLLIPPVITKFDDQLNFLFDMLATCNYKFAEDIVERLQKEVPTENLSTLKEGLSLFEDNNVYILKDSVYPSKVTTDGLHKMERRLLLDLTLFNMEDALETFRKLEKIYGPVQETFFFQNFSNLLNASIQLKENHACISMDDDQDYIGALDNTLAQVLSNHDFYRSEEVINKGLERNPNSIEWRIYKYFISIVMAYLKKNEECIKRRTMIDLSVGVDLKEAFPEGVFPRMTREDMKDVLEYTKEDLDDDEDYYSQYEEAYFKEFDFRKAKQILNKYLKQQKQYGNEESYDYLVDDVNTFIKNEDAGVDMYKLKSAYEFGLNYLEQEDYKTALQYFVKVNNLLRIPSSRIYCLMAYCFMKENKYDRAANLYKLAIENGPIPPTEIETAMVVLSKVGEYDEVIELLKTYDDYDPDDNVHVHYMGARAYLEYDRFDESKDELETCSTILEADNNLGVPFIDEMQAIGAAREGKQATFSIDDYIEYEPTDEENELSKDLDENYDNAIDAIFSLDTEDNAFAYNSKIKYALSVTKMLFVSCNYDRALNLLYLIDEYIDTPLLEEEEQKVYRRMVNNYKLI